MDLYYVEVYSSNGKMYFKCVIKITIICIIFWNIVIYECVTIHVLKHVAMLTQISNFSREGFPVSI